MESYEAQIQASTKNIHNNANEEGGHDIDTSNKFDQKEYEESR